MEESMPTKRKPKTKKPRELTLKELDYQIDYWPNGIKSSDDVTACCEIIGDQDRVQCQVTGL
jgi:hypothetical protein